ncbi:MAG: hypothetical protein KGH50_04105, partial [Candidatus Micrarchaeota archaeon]|nr:hypothetical protein [Candidatus Micrarchaeota archaeon]
MRDYMRRHLLLVLLLSMLFASIARAQSISTTTYCQKGGFIQILAPWYCSSTNGIDDAIKTSWADYAPLGFLAAMISFGIAALLIMFGIVLKNERLRTFGIGELYEAAATAFIVGMFAFVAAVLFGLLPSLVTYTVNPYSASLTYIATTINSTAALHMKLTAVALVDAWYSSISLTICNTNAEATSAQQMLFCGPSITTIFGRFIYYSFFWPAWSIVEFLSSALVSLWLQYYLIVFFLYAAIPAFLIPGVILRAFIPTRSFGGMLISVAIGFYFLMPLLFSVAYYLTNQSLSYQLSNAIGAIDRYGSGQGAQSNAITPFSPLITELTNIQQTFSSFWLDAIFFPAVNLSITYA